MALQPSGSPAGVPDKNAQGLLSNVTKVEFSSIKLKMLSGEAEVLE